MLFYNDPWKDNPYGKLHGELVDTWAILGFSEAKVHHHENTYVIAGYFDLFTGVTRSYKPENPMEAGLATFTIHSEDYEVRKKNDDGKYETVTQKASIHEKLLYQHISDNPTQWLSEKNLKGKIELLPDIKYAGKSNPQLEKGSCEIYQIEPTDKLPEWQPPKSSSGKSWNGSKGITLDEKINFLKKELCNTLLDDSFKTFCQNSDTPLSLLVAKVLEERSKEETFLATYFELLKAVVN